jgi:hypothetical protein
LSACRISSRTIAFCLAVANGRVGAAFAKSFARLCGLAVGLPGSPLTGSPLAGSPLVGSPLVGSPLDGSPLDTPLATPFATAGSAWIAPSAAAAAAAAASRCFLRAFLAPPERFFPCDYETGARETSDQARRRAARGVRRPRGTPQRLGERQPPPRSTRLRYLGHAGRPPVRPPRVDAGCLLFGSMAREGTLEAGYV